MYIRPETLFSYKFESYVNENISMKSQSNVHPCKEGNSNDSSNYIHSDYITYDGSVRERKIWECKILESYMWNLISLKMYLW